MTKSVLHNLLQAATHCDSLQKFIDDQKSESIDEKALAAIWDFRAGIRFRDVRKLSSLSQTKFSEKYGIPKRTIEDWDAQKRAAPPYLLEFILLDVLEEKVK